MTRPPEATSTLVARTGLRVPGLHLCMPRARARTLQALLQSTDLLAKSTASQPEAVTETHCRRTRRRFYTDAYDLFVIGLVKPMIAVLYYPELNGKLAKSDDLWITGVALVGTLIGQARAAGPALTRLHAVSWQANALLMAHIRPACLEALLTRFEVVLRRWVFPVRLVTQAGPHQCEAGA